MDKITFSTSKVFWVDSAERAVKTFAQSLVALFIGDSALSVINVDWESALAVGATGALVSVLTSVASGSVGPKDSAALFEAEVEVAVEAEADLSGE